MQSRLLLLGHFGLRLEGEPSQVVTISSKKARGLVAFLAMQPERSAERGALAALLWGERSDRNARQALRQCLSTLRAALHWTGAELLQSDGDKIRLGEAVSVDAIDFLALAEATDAAGVAQALALYRGPFLAGLDLQAEAFEQWLREQRLRTEMAAARLLETHARQMDATGNGVEAIAAVDRLIAIDPLREDWQRLGLQLCARHHGRDAALARAKTFSAMLTRELGVAAQPATLAVIEDVRRGAAGKSEAVSEQTLGADHIASAQPTPAEPPDDAHAAVPPHSGSWTVIRDYGRRYGIAIGFCLALSIDSILDAGVGPWYEKVFGATPGADRSLAELSSQSRAAKVADAAPADAASGSPAASSGAIPLLVIASREEGSADRYETDAFTDELTDSLAHFSRIKVLSRQTAHLFLTKSGDVTRLGSELGVRYVLETSLHPRAASTVLNVELIDAVSGVPIWSKRTDTANATWQRDRDDISRVLAADVDTELTDVVGASVRPEKSELQVPTITPR